VRGDYTLLLRRKLIFAFQTRKVLYANQNENKRITSANPGYGLLKKPFGSLKPGKFCVGFSNQKCQVGFLPS
jgi:hypothetical protein